MAEAVKALLEFENRIAVKKGTNKNSNTVVYKKKQINRSFYCTTYTHKK
jgi:hypothetical protein